MSMLSNSEIKECIESRTNGVIKWKNNQDFLLCLECDKDIESKNISMVYKCDSIDTYTLHCVCIRCIKTHLNNLNNKRNHNKINAIKKENRNQLVIKKSYDTQNTFGAFSIVTD